MVLMMVCMVGIWLSEQAFHLIFQNRQPKFLDWIPVRWFFDISEMAILVTFILQGIYDAWRELRR